MIKFEREAFLKLRYFTQLANCEVSGMGRSEIIDGDIVVTDIFILPQECTSTSTDIDEDAMAKFMNKEMIAGNSISDINIWWHTHYNFGVFWSITDTTTIATTTNGSFLISLVANQAMDILGRADIFNPTEVSFNLEIEKLKGHYSKRIKAECQEQLDECVREKVYVWENKDWNEKPWYNKILGFNQGSVSQEDGGYGQNYGCNDDYGQPYNPTFQNQHNSRIIDLTEKRDEENGWKQLTQDDQDYIDGLSKRWKKKHKK